MTSHRGVDSAGDDDASRAHERSATQVVEGELESERPPPIVSADGPRPSSTRWQVLIVLGFAFVGGVLGFFSAKRAERPVGHTALATAGREVERTATRETSKQFAEHAAEPAPRTLVTPTVSVAATDATKHVQQGPLDTPREHELLANLRTDAIVSARRGSGGRTLAFKLSLSSGISGYFKPEQSVSSAHWYAELAAYYLDRALGLGRVPPVVGRSVDWTALKAAATGDPRVPELTVGADGHVRGALIFWLNERLVPAATPPGWENWIRREPFGRASVSPYQRAAAYSAALAAVRERREHGEPIEPFYQSIPEPQRPELPAELSDMIIFDFLTVNYDRFGGGNANILLLGEAGPLVFLDNGDGFSAGPPRRSVLDARLAPVSRFRKRTIEALRAFDLSAFKERLANDPLAPILDEQALSGLAARRDAVLEHVAAQQTRYGDAVFAW